MFPGRVHAWHWLPSIETCAKEAALQNNALYHHLVEWGKEVPHMPRVQGCNHFYDREGAIQWGEWYNIATDQTIHDNGSEVSMLGLSSPVVCSLKTDSRTDFQWHGEPLLSSVVRNFWSQGPGASLETCLAESATKPSWILCVNLHASLSFRFLALRIRDLPWCFEKGITCQVCKRLRA